MSLTENIYNATHIENVSHISLTENIHNASLIENVLICYRIKHVTYRECS